MAIRLRTVDGVMVAICAARSVAKPGDIYLDDGAHHALTDKFAADFGSEGYTGLPTDAAMVTARALEESDNLNRTWWDSVYGEKAS